MSLGDPPPRVQATPSEKRDFRLAIVLPKMNINGVQKVHALLAADFLERGAEVDFVTSDPNGPMAAELPPESRIVPIGLTGGISFLLGLARYLRMCKPTHVISAYDDVGVVVIALRSLLNLRYFALIGMHNSIIGAHGEGGRLRRMKSRLILMTMRFALRRADAVVAVSEGLAMETTHVLRLPKHMAKVIYNPVITVEFEQKASEAPPEVPTAPDIPIIGFFGRLEPQKNVPMLLKAFAIARRAIPCQLLIVGEGSLMTDLHRQSVQLGVAQWITFHPFVRNPLPLIRQCSALVLPSRYEGASIILIEAMACGVQVIATDCPHGPAEILKDGELGQLVQVDDVEALAAAIENSLRGNFYVDPSILTKEALKYTLDASADSYAALMGIACNDKTKGKCG